MQYRKNNFFCNLSNEIRIVVLEVLRITKEMLFLHTANLSVTIKDLWQYTFAIAQVYHWSLNGYQSYLTQ